MNYLSFRWLGTTSLVTELIKPIESISLLLQRHSGPLSATLWRPDGSGLRVRSEMHDVADRIEIGVLTFDVVLTSSADEENVAVDGMFVPSQVFKLMMDESGTRAESGLVLKSNAHQKLTILAGVFPHSLAIEGLMDKQHIFKPEYPIEEYTPVSMN